MISDSDILAAYQKYGSKRAAAAALGIQRATFRARLAAIAPETKESPNAPIDPGDARIGGSAKDREIVRLRDEVARLGKEIKDQHRVSLDEEWMREQVGALVKHAVSPPNWLVRPSKSAGGTSEVPMVIFADWHAGEVVSREETNGVNEYDPAIMERRVRHLVERVVRLAREYGPGNYPGIVVNLLGDFVSGGLHPELAKTDAEEILPTVLRVVDLLAWALGVMAEEFGHVYAPCTAGNHGRGTPKPEFKRYVYKNFDWLIYQLLARHFAADKRIVFDIRPSNEVHFRVFGQRYLAMHGDMLGVKGGDGIIGALGPIARGEVKTRGQASSSGLDYDVLLMGHWHQSLWLPRAIVSNTLKGYDEFAKNALRAPISAPSQPLWYVHPKYGITSRWDVKVDDVDTKATPEWVSVFAEAA